MNLPEDVMEKLTSLTDDQITEIIQKIKDGTFNKKEYGFGGNQFINFTRNRLLGNTILTILEPEEIFIETIFDRIEFFFKYQKKIKINFRYKFKENDYKSFQWIEKKII